MKIKLTDIVQCDAMVFGVVSFFVVFYRLAASNFKTSNVNLIYLIFKNLLAMAIFVRFFVCVLFLSMFIFRPIRLKIELKIIRMIIKF